MKNEKTRVLNFPLLHFSNNKIDDWTFLDAVRGVQIFGGIGSGKSSGSGQTIALSYLKQGFGGIVLTGKVDEKDNWIRYAKMTNRLKDVIVFGEKDLNDKNTYKFNPLSYETNRQGEGAGETENIVSLFTSIIKMGNRINGNSANGSSDAFWDMALQRCIKSSIDLLKLAKEGYIKNKPENNSDKYSLTVANIARIIRESPIGKGWEDKFDSIIKENRRQDLLKAMNDSYTIDCIFWARKNLDIDFPKEFRAYEVAKNYFLSDLATLSDKTRSSIVEYFYAFANPFRSGLLADYFAQDTSIAICPEETFEGKIIILDFPVKKYLQLGIYAQAIYKKMWQQAVERRTFDSKSKPVFMWIDEAQYFLNEDDMLFQTTARSSGACTVLISQNISNYYATIGGEHAKERVDSILGNLATKIFHANNDYVTNEWAANTIGKTFQKQRSMSIGQLQNISITEALNYQIEPQIFSVLKNGGDANNYKVEAVVTVAGKKWSNDKNYIETSFQQNIETK